MYNATESFAEFNKLNVANATKLAALSLENAEKLFKLNLTATKAALATGVQNAQAVASVKDLPEFLALRSKVAESGVQGAVGYSRTLYALASEARRASPPSSTRPASRPRRARKSRSTR